MRQGPRLPYVLGIAGLVPFVFFSAAIFFGPVEYLPLNFSILLWYAAVILSFLGGTRWGAEIAVNPDNPSATILILSMLPSLAGWGSLVFFERYSFPLGYMAALITLGILMLGFAAHLQWDLQAIRNKLFPPWYAHLRIILSTVAILSLAGPFFANFNLMTGGTI